MYSFDERAETKEEVEYELVTYKGNHMREFAIKEKFPSEEGKEVVDDLFPNNSTEEEGEGEGEQPLESKNSGNSSSIAYSRSSSSSSSTPNTSRPITPPPYSFPSNFSQKQNEIIYEESFLPQNTPPPFPFSFRLDSNSDNTYPSTQYIFDSLENENEQVKIDNNQKENHTPPKPASVLDIPPIIVPSPLVRPSSLNFSISNNPSFHSLSLPARPVTINGLVKLEPVNNDPVFSFSAESTKRYYGEDLEDKLERCTFYFTMDNTKSGRPMGIGWTIEDSNHAITTSHYIINSKVGDRFTGFFIKPNSGQSQSIQLEVTSFDHTKTCCILSIPSSTHKHPFLSVSYKPFPEEAYCTVASHYIAGFSVATRSGKIIKTLQRHVIYDSPSFSGNSDGTLILYEGLLVGIHLDVETQSIESTCAMEDSFLHLHPRKNLLVNSWTKEYNPRGSVALRIAALQPCLQ